MDKPLLGWAVAPTNQRWHQIRRVSPAEGMRAGTMLHALCGLAFLSDATLRRTHAKEGAVCPACISAGAELTSRAHSGASRV